MKKNLAQPFNLSQKIILFTLVCIPIFLNLFAFDVFEIPKIKLFQFLTVCILLTTVLFTKVRCKIDFSKHKVLISLLSLNVLILTASTFLSPYFWTSFWGSYSHQMGYISHVFFSMFFALVFINFPTKKNVQTILKVLMWGSIFPVVYGLLQIVGLDFIGWNDASYGHRIFSTFGQPNFFASYLLFVIPITYFFIREKTKQQRLLALLLAGQLFCLIFTGSRGGMIGFVAEIAVVAFLSNSKKIKIVVGICTSLIVFSIILFTFIPSQLDFFQFNARFPSGRQLIWQASLQAIIQRPLLGYGMDATGHALSPLLTPEIITYEALNIPDRAHNIFLDITVTTGLLGLMSFGLLAITLGFLIRKKIQEKDTIAPVIGIALSGYLVQNLFNFDTSVSYLFAGVLVTLLLIDTIKRNLGNEGRKVPSPTLLHIFPGVVLFCFSAYFSFSPLLADVFYKSGLSIVNAPAQESRDYYAQAVLFNPNENEYLLAYVENLTADGNDIDAIQKVPTILTQIQNRESPNFLYYLAIAKYQAVIAQKEHSLLLLNQALENAITAKTLAPYRIEPLLLQTNILEVLGRNKEARETLEYFLKITPEKYHNKEILEQYQRLQYN